jgi:hypothetical protein
MIFQAAENAMRESGFELYQQQKKVVLYIPSQSSIIF